MFLSADELRELTGFVKPKLQRQWLLDNGYRFDVRRDGRPAMLAEQVSARQLKGLHSRAKAEETPDFAALES